MTGAMRVNAVLLVALVASAMALVRSVYEMRQLVDAQHKASDAMLELNGERTRLEAERQAAGTTKEVERRARERLEMRPITPAITWYEGFGPASAPPSPLPRGGVR